MVTTTRRRRKKRGEDDNKDNDDIVNDRGDSDDTVFPLNCDVHDDTI